MSETYVALGLSMPWSVAVFGVLAMFIPFLRKGKDGKRLRPTPMYLMFAGYFALAGLLGIPTEWLPPAMMIIVGIATLIPSRELPLKLSRRITMAASSIALGILCFLGFRTIMYPGQIILADDSVSWTEFGRGGAVPRAGLRVHATGRPKGWWETRSWYSWTSYSGRKLGPSLHGGMLFIGPHGVMRGDQVGERLAKWAGTEPKVRMRTLDD